MPRNHETTKHGFRLDELRLEEIVLKIYDAIKNNRGIFQDGYQHFLPQWNLPLELEYSPQKRKLRNPEQAARFLWVRTFCDRLSISRHLIETALATWHNSEVNWIYDPFEVRNRSEEEIGNVLRNHLHFGLNNEHKEQTNGWRFSLNAFQLVNEYDGDPRNIIQYNNVDQSRKNLMEFQGIGTGLANLFIIQMYDREITISLDPENAMLKVDRHKAGIAVYTGAIKPVNAEIEQNLTVPILEDAYKKIALKHRLDIRVLDAALWITGSEVCTRKDYFACLTDCPLVKDYCISRGQLDGRTGRYTVFDKGGNRIETRRGVKQDLLFH